jgi:hypothetical protein
VDHIFALTNFQPSLRHLKDLFLQEEIACLSPGAFKTIIKHKPPYYKTWSKVNIGLKLLLSLLFAKRVTVTASVLNQD